MDNYNSDDYIKYNNHDDSDDDDEYDQYENYDQYDQYENYDQYSKYSKYDESHEYNTKYDEYDEYDNIMMNNINENIQINNINTKKNNKTTTTNINKLLDQINNDDQQENTLNPIIKAPEPYLDKIDKCIRNKYLNKKGNIYYRLYFIDMKILRNYELYYINNYNDQQLKNTVFIKYNNTDINSELMGEIIKYVDIENLADLCMTNKDILKYKYIWSILIEKHFGYKIEDADINIYLNLLYNYCVKKSKAKIILDIFDCYFESSINNNIMTYNYIEKIHEYINKYIYSNIHILSLLYVYFYERQDISSPYKKEYFKNVIKLLYKRINNIILDHIQLIMDNKLYFTDDDNNNQQVFYNILIKNNTPFYLIDDYMELYDTIESFIGKKNLYNDLSLDEVYHIAELFKSQNFMYEFIKFSFSNDTI